MQKKRTLALMLAAGMAVSMVPMTAMAEESHEEVTLRFMWWGGDERAEATLAVIDQFQEKYPWITIEAEYGSSDGYQEKLTTQLSSGTEADIIQMGVGWMPGYVNSGSDYFVDFLEYPDLISFDNFEQGFLETNGNFDGHQYGIPTGLAGTALIYNKTLADEIGLEFPEELTWDDLLELGKKVQEYDSSKYLLTMNDVLLNTTIFQPYIQQLTGKTILDDATMTVGATEEEILQALQYIASLYENGVIVPISQTVAYGQDGLQTDPSWISADTYVSMFCYTSTAEPAVAAVETEGIEFAAASLPEMADAKDDGYFCNCPQYMCVSKNSEHVEEAIMFLDYFYNDEEAAATLGTVRSVPPTSTAQAVCADLGLLDGIAKETVDVCQKYSGIINNGYSTEAEAAEIIQNALASVAYGESTPEDAAADMYKLLTNYIESQ